MYIRKYDFKICLCCFFQACGLQKGLYGHRISFTNILLQTIRVIFYKRIYYTACHRETLAGRKAEGGMLVCSTMRMIAE